MAMEAQNRGRPSLELKTDYRDVGGYERTPFRTHRPSLSASAKPLPSPMYPSTPENDDTSRRMVELLDNRGRHGSFSARPLTPITERSMAANVGRMMSANSPLSPRAKPLPALPLTAPTTPIPPTCSEGYQRRQSIVAEARDMLLSGMPHLQAIDLGTPVDRRQSAPAEQIQKYQKQRRQSQIPSSMELHAWGHIYFGDVTNADIFVAPAAIRRASAGPSADGLESQSNSNRLMIRARIRPRSKDRKPFLIQRSFDLDELRATIPNNAPASPQNRRDISHPGGPPGTPSPTHAPTSPLVPRRRRSSVATLSGQASPRAGRVAEVSRNLSRGSKEVPVRKFKVNLSFLVHFSSTASCNGRSRTCKTVEKKI